MKINLGKKEIIHFIGIGGMLLMDLCLNENEEQATKKVSCINRWTAALLLVYMLMELAMGVQTQYAQQLCTLTVLLATSWCLTTKRHQQQDTPVRVVEGIPTGMAVGSPVTAQPLSI